MARLHKHPILQSRCFGPVCITLLAVQRRDLWHDSHRDRFPVPDLAAAHASLPACGGDIPPSPVRRPDGAVLLLVRHGDGPHELRAPGVARAPGPSVEARDRRHGDDLRREMRLLRSLDGVVSCVRRPWPDQDSRLPRRSIAGGQRRAIGESALPGAPRRTGTAGFRRLSLRRPARSGIVVAGSFLLRAGAQSSVRSSDLQLDRREPDAVIVFPAGARPPADEIAAIAPPGFAAGRHLAVGDHLADARVAPGRRGGRMETDVIIIGAGLSGMYQLHRVRELGLSVRVFEAGGDVGGTWYWNRYPGARFDSESWTYGFSFSAELLREWDWSEHFSPQPETLRYCNLVAYKFDLRRDIVFNSRVASARYDDGDERWEIVLADGGRARARSPIA